MASPAARAVAIPAMRMIVPRTRIAFGAREA
jgi:hypothetical protein